MPEINRPLKVFLSYASQDKPLVRELSRRLVGEGWIDTWQDEKSLLPGQDWRVKIEEAVEEADIVIICLSNQAVNKEGYVQKELRYAREIALEKPEDTIFLIPLRLDECEVPRGLRFYQWVDYFGDGREQSYGNLIAALQLKYKQKEEKAAHEESEKVAAEKARLKAEEDEQQRIAKEKAKREAAEKEVAEKARLKEEEDEQRRIAKEKAEREAVEKAWLKAEEEERKRIAKEKSEREAAEKGAVEKKILRAEEEQRHKAVKEKEDREAAVKVAQNRVKREVTQQTGREWVERQGTRKAMLSRMLIEAGTLFKIVGGIGIIILLFWFGSLVTPKFILFMPTVSTITELSASAVAKTDTPQLTRMSVWNETPTSTPFLTPIPQAIILLQEDFEDGKADGWGDNVFGDWAVEQDANGNQYWSGSGSSDYSQNRYFDVSTLNWTDYAFESRIQFVKGNILQFCIRADIEDNCYGVGLDNNNATINYFQGNPANKEEELISFHSSPNELFVYNQWYTIRIEVEGNNLRVYINNVLDADITLPNPIMTRGGIGYFMNSGSKFYIDDIRVWSLADRLPAPDPLSPSDNSVFDYLPRTITLRWDPIPGAVKYIVRIQFCAPGSLTDCGPDSDDEVTTEMSFYTFDFVGAQPGRWQVWAVDSTGLEGYRSEWWYFTFLR